jgi:hypothetical protein
MGGPRYERLQSDAEVRMDRNAEAFDFGLLERRRREEIAKFIVSEKRRGSMLHDPDFRIDFFALSEMEKMGREGNREKCWCHLLRHLDLEDGIFWILATGEGGRGDDV